MRTALIAVLLLQGSPAWPAEPQPVFPLFPYEKQGRAVTAPAQFLATPIYQVGFMVGAIVCLPVSIIQDPHAVGRVGHDREASIVCGRGLGTALGWPVYAAVGLPLFLGKTLFWDAPRALFKPKSAPRSSPEKP